MIKILEPFTQPLNIPVLAPRGRRRYKLVEDYVAYISIDGVDWKIVVPKDFEYDGASVPRLVWSLSDLTPDGLIRAAACVHDFAYEHKGKMPLGSTFKQNPVFPGAYSSHYLELTRRQSDDVFKALMQRGGVNKTSRNRAYKAVRWFGWWAWRT